MIPEHVRLTQLIVADSYCGLEIVEEPKGSNRGYWVELFQESGGGNEGDAWCMHYVVHCHIRACKIQRYRKPWLKVTGWCRGQWEYALKEPRLKIITAEQMADGYVVPPGAVWVRYDASGKGHTGFVESFNPNTGIMKSNEGNASDGVRVKTYNIEDIKDFKGVIL